MTNFASAVIAWQRHNGRRGLPWQGTRDPYRIWLSEVMLQQTQVAAVIPYYERFLKRFPSVEALAGAGQEEVLELWSGLGYYARGRNLHAAAREISRLGKFPARCRDIEELPGVGRSTAAAIAAFAFGERAAILDGNVKRVLARHYGVADAKDLWPLAERLLPKRGIETYTQALMDLGATVCIKGQPRCGICPVSRSCLARKEDRIHEFPGARRKKALPLRKTTWLLLVHEGKILLQRRPSRGLWGGLLTFPEAAVKGCEIASRRKLPVVEHGFTHFRLRAQPILCTVTAKRQIPGCVWVSLSKAELGAVPAPVRQLLIGVRARYFALRKIGL